MESLLVGTHTGELVVLSYIELIKTTGRELNSLSSPLPKAEAERKLKYSFRAEVSEVRVEQIKKTQTRLPALASVTVNA